MSMDDWNGGQQARVDKQVRDRRLVVLCSDCISSPRMVNKATGQVGLRCEPCDHKWRRRVGK